MEKYYRKYVWDEGRTPYLVPVARMTRKQAEYEMLFYAVITGVLFAMIALMSLSPDLPHGDTRSVSLFAFTQVCASVLLGATGGIWSARYCASAPLAALLYFALFGFHPNLGAGDKTLLLAAMVLWVGYCWRLQAVARAYPTLAETYDQR